MSSTREVSTQSSSKKKTLPDGWIIRESRRHKGRFYYFNENTGLSSWTLPSETPQAKQSSVHQNQKPTPSGSSGTDSKTKVTSSSGVGATNNVKPEKIRRTRWSKETTDGRARWSRETTDNASSSCKTDLQSKMANRKQHGTSTEEQQNKSVKRKVDSVTERENDAEPKRKQKPDGLSLLQASYTTTIEDHWSEHQKKKRQLKGLKEVQRSHTVWQQKKKTISEGQRSPRRLIAASKRHTDTDRQKRQKGDIEGQRRTVQERQKGNIEGQIRTGKATQKGDIEGQKGTVHVQERQKGHIEGQKKTVQARQKGHNEGQSTVQERQKGDIEGQIRTGKETQQGDIKVQKRKKRKKKKGDTQEQIRTGQERQSGLEAGHHADTDCGRTASRQQAIPSGHLPQRQRSSIELTDDNGGEVQVEVFMDVEMVEVQLEEVKGHLNQVRDEIHSTSNLIDKPTSSLPVSTSQVSTHKNGLYIVLDTNVLISHLRFLEDLRDQPIRGFGIPILVIPWVVLQELDGLKTGHSTTDSKSTVARQAIAAGHFIHNCIKCHHPRVICQSPQSTMKATVPIECNDDRILQCCLQYQHMGVGMAVVLFTNDINLCIKTIASGVNAFTKQDLISGLKDLASSRGDQPTEDYNKDTSNKIAADIKISPNTSVEVKVPVTEHANLAGDEEKSKKKMDEEKRAQREAEIKDDNIAEIVCELKQLLIKGLSAALEREMKSAYDEQWLDIVLIKPPWTFTDLLKCYQKHWIAVFMMFLDRVEKSYLDEIQNHFRTNLGHTKNMETAHHLAHNSYLLTSKLLQHDKSNKVLEESVNDLTKLIERCKPAKERAKTENHQSDDVSTSRQIPSGTDSSYKLPESPGLSSHRNTPIHRTESFIYDDGDVEMTPEDISVPVQDDSAILQVFQSVGETVFEKSASILTILHEGRGEFGAIIPSIPGSDRHHIERSLVFLCSLLLTIIIAMARLLHCVGEPADSMHSACQGICNALDEFSRGCKVNQPGHGLRPSSFQHFISMEPNRETFINGLKQFAEKLQELHEFIKIVDDNVYSSCRQTLMALASQIFR